MLIVAEKINTSRKSISEAVEKRDSDFIKRIAQGQAAAGAHYIDVNAGTFVGEETDCLCWLVRTVQDAVDLPLALDSPDPKALTEAIKIHRGEPMINSISMEKDRLDSILAVAVASPCHIVALCMGETGMPVTVQERFDVGSELISKLREAGIPLEKIHVDPLIQPVSVDINMGVASLGAIQKIMEGHPGVKTICGLSNISYGLPERRLINRSFLSLAMCYGLSGAIIDPMDKDLMSTLIATEMLLGRDEYCDRFINAYQSGRIGVG